MMFVMAARATAIDPPTSIRLVPSDAHLYPIGWSHDGTFAYVLVDEPIFRTGFGFKYEIVDARTDAVLWTHYEHSDTFEWQGAGAPLAVAWNRNGREVMEQLDRFGIELVEDAGLQQFPLRRGVDEYTAHVSEWRANPETTAYRNSVVGYTLALQSRELGSKVIARRGRIFATSVEVHGYIRSPFENRVVLVVSESGNAYGETRFTDYTIIGAHLDVGFE